MRTLRVVGDWKELSTVRCQTVLRWMEQTFQLIGCGFSPIR
jgi:hypothetical protein